MYILPNKLLCLLYYAVEDLKLSKVEKKKSNKNICLFFSEISCREVVYQVDNLDNDQTRGKRGERKISSQVRREM